MVAPASNSFHVHEVLHNNDVQFLSVKSYYSVDIGDQSELLLTVLRRGSAVLVQPSLLSHAARSLRLPRLITRTAHISDISAIVLAA